MRLWICEVRLRFDLRYSRGFKSLCEKRGYLNLANLEEGYIHKVQNEIAEIQQRRAALRTKNHSPPVTP